MAAFDIVGMQVSDVCDDAKSGVPLLAAHLLLTRFKTPHETGRADTCLFTCVCLAPSTVPGLGRNLRKCLQKACSTASPTVPSAALGMCMCAFHGFKAYASESGKTIGRVEKL